MSEEYNCINDMSLLHQELDRLGAPKVQPSGYPLSALGRFRSLVAGEAGKNALYRLHAAEAKIRQLENQNYKLRVEVKLLKDNLNSKPAKGEVDDE